MNLRSYHLPLKYRLLITVMAASISGIILMSTALVLYDRHLAKNNMVREMTVLARIIANRSTAALSFSDPQLANTNLKALNAQPTVLLACMYNVDNNVFAIYHRDKESNEPCPPQMSEAGFSFTENHLFITQKISLKDQNIGALYFKLSLSDINSRLFEIIEVILYVSIFAAVTIIILTNWLQLPITKPLLALTEIANKISKAKDYSVRAEKQSSDELGVLVDAFNEMLDQIALREIQRDKAELELNAHRDHLEELVSERTKELHKAIKELEAFSYSVSHDLRTPLRTIRSFSQIIEEDCKDKLGDSCKDHLNRIQLSTDRMAEIIDDLLNLSRLSRKEMKLQQVDLSALARNIADNFDSQKENRKVSFLIEDGLTAMADEHLIKVVLENIIGNALKYSSKKDNAVITFGKEIKDGNIYYFVKDNGVGFEMPYVNKIFEPFQRLHSLEEFEGTGIGLAIVARIIERHKGSVSAIGDVDKGATIYFTLGKNLKSENVSTANNPIN